LKKISSLIALSALLVVACAAFAADGPIHPRYVVLPQHGTTNASVPPATLQTWTGHISGSSYPYIQVGTDPSSTNVTTTVNVFIIPVKICVTPSGGSKTCFDPATTQANGKTATQNVLASPIFKNQDYTIDGTDLGNTQYEDAFQRSNYWTDVMTNTNYHVLLKPVLIPEQTLNVPAADGSIGSGYFGIPQVALVDINYLDQQINAGLPKIKAITPASFALIMTYNTYLTEGGCCIGGYHSATGAQSYGHFTYTTPASGTSFSQDVSAMSHEIGEWLDDPLTNGGNNSPCGILEVGDPIEGETGAHPFGDYTYSMNGMTYHLQDLATMQYFGQSPSTVNNGNWTFQGQTGTLPGYSRPIGECSYGS
jgi:hypothetical protein